MYRIVQKALPKEPEWKYQHHLADEYLEKWQKAFLVSVENLQSKITLAQIEQAIRDGDIVIIEQSVDWEESFDNKLQENWEPLMKEIAQRSGAVALQRLKVPFRFDLDNPYSVTWLREHGAELVKQVSDETRAAIRAVVVEAFEKGYHPYQIAPRISQMVGLTTREALAVERYWARLAQDGTLTDKQVNAATDRYARKLLRLRGERIARTETITASAAGTRQSWQVARDNGYILPEARRVWIAATMSDRTCPICMSLDGKQATLDGVFHSDEYGDFQGVPAHVMCRCAEGLITVPAEVKPVEPELRQPVEIPRRGHLSAEEYFGADIGNPDIIQERIFQETGNIITHEEAKNFYNATQSWSGVAYRMIREYQISGKSIPGSIVDLYARSLDRFIEVSPKFDGELYRGIQGSKTLLKQLKEGAIIDMRGTSSWTSDLRITKDFIGKGEYPIIFKVPQTNWGTSITHLSRHPEEKEVIIHSKAQFMVRNIKETKVAGVKCLFVELEELAELKKRYRVFLHKSKLSLKERKPTKQMAMLERWAQDKFINVNGIPVKLG